MKGNAKFLNVTKYMITVAICGVAFGTYSANGYGADQPVMTRTGIVQTGDGPIRGFVDNGVREFLGIPYAAPPVGHLRWRPPQKPVSWDKPKNTVKFGDRCPQTITLVTFAAKSSTEDCLYLNVFAPKAATNGPRPVMVWIHGGGLVDGSGNPYDPTKLVKQGNAIVVTFNYRLNFLGFFALPSLDTESHELANYGLMDQQFALEWVHKNIAAFGGDPNNVTLFGESAGGLSVLANLVSPKASRLFQRAIVESPAKGQRLRLDQPSLHTAEARGIALAKAVGCKNLKVSCLRALSVQQLQKLVTSYTTSFIVDGTVLPQTFRAAFKSGDFNHVPIINGNNEDERRFAAAVKEIAAGKALTSQQYPVQLQTAYGTNAKAVLSQYPLIQYDSPSVALATATGDSLMICPTRKLDQWLSRFVPVYTYEFADRTAPMFFPPVSFPYGASHTTEIQYLFTGYHGALGISHPLNRLQNKLSDQMVSYWTTFAASGNPNSGTTPHWPPYTAQNGKFQVFKLPGAFTVPDSQHSLKHRCGFWDSLH